MICKNCGATIEDGVKFCTKCGEPAAEAVQEATEVVQEASAEATDVKEKVADVAEEVKETVANVTNEVKEVVGDAAEKVKAFPKKTLIAVAVIALVLIVVVANFKTVTNSVSKLVSSPEKYYANVEKDQIKELAGSIADTYGNNVLENIDFSDYSVDYNVEVELSEDAREMIAEALDVDDTDAFAKMAADFFVSLKGNNISMEAAASLGKNQVISANAVMDMDKGEAWAQIPELSEKYIGISLDEYAEDFAEEYAMVMEQSAKITDALPKPKTIEKLITRYLAIAVENVGSVKEEKDTLKVGDTEQKCTSIRVRIKADDMYKIMVAILEEAKDDKELHDLVADVVCAAYEAMEEEMDRDDIIDKLTEAIETALEELENLEDMEETEDEMELVMNVWVDGKGEVIGREVKMNDDPIFSYKMAQKGSKFEFEASAYTTSYRFNNETYEYESYQKEVVLEGTGKKSSSSLSGEFALKMKDGKESVKLFEVKVDDFKTKKIKEGYIDGSFTISLSKDIIGKAFRGTQAAMVSPFLSKYELKFDLKSGKKDANVAVTILDDDEMFAKVGISAKIGSGKSAKLPKGIMVEDEEDIMEWAETINTEKFLKKIEKSGLPVEVVEEVEDACEMLEDALDE